MKVTRQQMLEIVPSGSARMSDFLHYINAWADTFEINTPKRMAMFLGQVLAETGGFRYTKELGDDDYFKKYEKGKLAQQLGNKVKGDGAKYKGRGLLMITGRTNYKAYQNSGYCTGDIMNEPSLLEKPCGASKSGMWWWWKHGCNAIADTGNIERLTKKINGGLNGLEDRTKWTNKCMKVLC